MLKHNNKPTNSKNIYTQYSPKKRKAKTPYVEKTSGKSQSSKKNPAAKNSLVKVYTPWLTFLTLAATAIAIHSFYISVLIHSVLTVQPQTVKSTNSPTGTTASKFLIEYILPIEKSSFKPQKTDLFTLKEMHSSKQAPALIVDHVHSAALNWSNLSQTAFLIAAISLLHFIFQQSTTHPSFDPKAMQRIGKRLFASCVYSINPKKQKSSHPTQQQSAHLLYSPVYQTHNSSNHPINTTHAVTLHKKAAHLLGHLPCALYLMPGDTVNSFSLFADQNDGAIWITYGALSSLNGDQMLALFTREQAASKFYKKQGRQTLMWYTICLSYCLSWTYVQGINLLMRASLGSKDPRPWHAKNGHPIYAFGIILLILGLGGALGSQLIARIIQPGRLRAYADKISVQATGNRTALLSLLKLCSTCPHNSYPKDFFAFLSLALHDTRFLSEQFASNLTLQKRIKKIEKATDLDKNAFLPLSH